MPSHVSSLERQREIEHTNRRQGCEDWRDNAADQGIPRNAATRSWKRQGTDFVSEPLKAVYLCQHLNFRLLTSSIMGEEMSVILSQQSYGNLF